MISDVHGIQTPPLLSTSQQQEKRMSMYAVPEAVLLEVRYGMGISRNMGTLRDMSDLCKDEGCLLFQRSSFLRAQGLGV